MAAQNCIWCGRSKPLMDFPRSKAMWFKNGVANICTDCLEDQLDCTDLNLADKILQYLDIPFNPNEWIQLYEDNGSRTLRVYLTRYIGQKNTRNLDWSRANEKWKERRNNGTLDQSIEVLNQDYIEEMREKWGDYSVEEYGMLEALYKDILRTQNIITGIQVDQAQNLCRLSLIVRSKIQHGEDASKELKMYNDLIKAGGFEPKNARSYGEFESIGEVINYLVRKGYQPKFYDGQERDMVDLTMKNTQAYLQRLVANEPNLPDLVAQRRDGYRIAQQLEEEGLDDASMDQYNDSTVAVSFEDEDDFAGDLNNDE